MLLLENNPIFMFAIIQIPDKTIHRRTEDAGDEDDRDERSVFLQIQILFGQLCSVRGFKKKKTEVGMDPFWWTSIPIISQHPDDQEVNHNFAFFCQGWQK